MNFIDAVEDSVEVNGISYDCDLSMAAVFLCFEVAKDEGLTDEERVLTDYELLVDDSSRRADSLKQKSAVVSKIFQKKINKEHESATVNDSPKYFDFEQDNDLIYTSILQQYNINIRDRKVISTLRWKDFMGLFGNLDKKTPFGKAVYFRQLKITDDMSDEQKDYYREMKKYYALKKDEHHLSFAEMDLPHKVAYLAAQRKKQKEG